MDNVTGTIFGVYLADPSKTATENALQPGKKLLAGGYCLYSSAAVSLEFLRKFSCRCLKIVAIAPNRVSGY